MRILLVTRNLPPLVGGMERLNWHLAAELAKVAEVRVIGPHGSAAQAPAGVLVREAPLKPLWQFVLHARRLARREAHAWKPDWVLAGSGLAAPMVRSAARVRGARTAVYAHGLDIAVRHPVYRALWLPAIRRVDRVIANSHATATLCRGIGVAPARIEVVYPGVELPARGAAGNPDPAAAAVAAWRSRCGFGARPLLLSVGRLSARKGLREFVTHALPVIVAEHPDALLVIVGGAPKDALLGTAQTPDAIRAAAAQAGVAANVTLLGCIADDDLAAAYAASSVHVFPVREIPGDPEGFGMVAIEAAAHGLPTVAFATGGVPDAIVEGESGSLAAPGDYAAFAVLVNAWLARAGREALGARCMAAAERFGWSRFGAEIRAALGLASP